MSPTIYKRKPNSMRQQWNQEDMQLAIKKVRNKAIGIREAARKYNVPYTTLYRRIHSNDSRYHIGVKMGRSSCLGPENERKLSEHLKKMNSAGFPLTLTKVRELAFEFASLLGISHQFNQGHKKAGYDWFALFMRRNPDLSIRRAEGLSASRARGLSRMRVQAFYDLLEGEVTKYDLKNKPQNISNCDESGLQLINSTCKVIAPKGSKVVHQVTTGEKGETVTLLACCTAEGQFFPPTIILKGKNLKPEFQDGLPSGAKVFMNQKSAYVNTPLFLKWFEEVYVPRKAPGRNILILDGHCSHSLSIVLLESAEKNNVSLICLPSHTTHVLQPLDKSFFGPLKAHFKTATSAWVNQNIGRKVTRYQLGPLVQTAWNKAATVGNATSGFRSTGIFPFNRDAISDHFFTISDSIQNAQENDSNKEEEEQGGTPLQSQTKNRRRILVSSLSSTSLRSSNQENHSPTKILTEIMPVPVLSAIKITGRPTVGAVLLSSKSHHEKLLQSVEKKKGVQEKCKRSQKEKDKEESIDESTTMNEKIPRKKKGVGKTKTTAPKAKDKTTKGVDPVNLCKECNNSFLAGENDNLLRCHKCKVWLHVTCSIFDDSCIDCGRKILQERR